jgi:hypothetical protein
MGKTIRLAVLGISTVGAVLVVLAAALVLIGYVINCLETNSSCNIDNAFAVTAEVFVMTILVGISISIILSIAHGIKGKILRASKKGVSREEWNG